MLPPEVAERLKAAAAQPPACPPLPANPRSESVGARFDRWLLAAQRLDIEVIGQDAATILAGLASAWPDDWPDFGGWMLPAKAEIEAELAERQAAAAPKPKASPPKPVLPKGARAIELSEVHQYPLASDGKDDDGVFAPARRMPAGRAWKKAYVEVNPANCLAFLPFDVDLGFDLLGPQQVYGAVEHGLIPMPTVQVFNEETGRQHLAYVLADPVHRNEHSALAPISAAGRIADYLQAAIPGADPCFAGLLCRNPTPGIDPKALVVRRDVRPYTLAALLAYIPARWRRPRPAERSAAGRNCTLFSLAIQWAGRAANRGVPAEAWLTMQNLALFPASPLPQSEVAGIARSVERYRQLWETAGWHSERFRAQQAARGRKSGEARARAAANSAVAVAELRADGLTYRQIGARLGFSKDKARRLCLTNQHKVSHPSAAALGKREGKGAPLGVRG